MGVRWAVLIVLVLTCSTMYAQEGQLQSDFRRESEHLKEDCGSFSFKSIASCGQELFTDHPLHIAAGSISPQNGFGLGAAFVAHYTPNENWRLSWDVDAVGSFNSSYRAGAYMKLIHTPPQQIHVSIGPSNGTTKSASNLTVHPYTVFNLSAQTISLNKLFFFGEGPDSTLAGQSVFGMKQTILGGSVIKPVYEWAAMSKLNLALLGEVNGRFVNIRGNSGESSPTIGQLYDEATAPGLTTQPAFLQLGEGLRLEPNLFSNHLQLNYLVNFQQFFAPSNSAFSFRRWTVDLGHNFPLYQNSVSNRPKDSNGPDECASAVGATSCPSISRNRTGTVGVRLLISESAAGAGSAVPFYFQPTLGGSDIDGNPALSSFQDYRFRAPNILLLRESFEHSIWGPVGFTFAVDEGKVALRRDDVDFGNLRHSFSTGLTLRAGGFPQVFLLFAWGGGEGHHTIAGMNTSLLGGSARPSLY